MGVGLAHKLVTGRKGRQSAHVPKTAKQIERHMKGVANHWRILILLLVSEERGINVEGITESLHGNFKTISDHIRKLVQAGLLDKKYKGSNVLHSLSPYGDRFVKFIKEFRDSVYEY
jgi:predicted transcriptional regulator